MQAGKEACITRSNAGWCEAKVSAAEGLLGESNASAVLFCMQLLLSVTLQLPQIVHPLNLFCT